MPNLRIFDVGAKLENKAIKVDGGFFCQAAGETQRWILLPDEDVRRCDSVTHCHNGFDEEFACKQVNVTGSRGRHGIYLYHNATDTYKQQGGGNWTFKEGGEMYKEGKAVDDNGFICKVRDLNSGGNIEEWTYIDTRLAQLAGLPRNLI